MIQRIQTLFLLLAFLCLGATFFSYAWSNAETPQQTEITGDVYVIYSWKTIVQTTVTGKSENTLNYLGMGVQVLSMILCLTIVAFYRQRIRQMRLCGLAAIGISSLLGIMFMAIREARTHLEADAGSFFWLSFYLPILALILVMLAMHFIRKDEMLVRSADRMR